MPGRSQGEGWKGANQAWSVTASLLAGIVVWGGVGKLLDRWLGFANLFTPIGMILGLGAAIYLVYIKYGRLDEA
jgi:F0F1-type ATP synthase assembly protein I